MNYEFHRISSNSRIILIRIFYIFSCFWQTKKQKIALVASLALVALRSAEFTPLNIREPEGLNIPLLSQHNLSSSVEAWRWSIPVIDWAPLVKIFVQFCSNIPIKEPASKFSVMDSGRSNRKKQVTSVETSPAKCLFGSPPPKAHIKPLAFWIVAPWLQPMASNQVAKPQQIQRSK